MEGDEVAGLARSEQEGASGKQVEDSMVELHCQGNSIVLGALGSPAPPKIPRLVTFAVGGPSMVVPLLTLAGLLYHPWVRLLFTP